MLKITEQTLFADRYLFQRLLGRGGFSEVWLAIDKMTNLEIAVKVYAPGQGMDSDGMKDFCKELSQVYNLNHTNLLKPQHVDSWEGMPYLVMTYCPQGSCHRLIGTMTEDQIWKMLHDVSSGLAYLHEQGIIHQDIKPDNILIDPLGNYVITDFGISVQSRSTLRKSMNIATGSGTTAYMGPERFSKAPTPLKASDIWSLGATAYELLTGNAPFGEIGGGLQKGGADLPTIKKDISSELRMVLTKMLALEAWDRPTAEQLSTWAKEPKKIDFNVEQPNDPAKKPSITPQTEGSPNQAPSITSNTKSIFIGVVIAVFVVLVGGITWFVHSANVEKERQERIERGIKIQLEMNKTCDKYISDLNDRNILDRLDITVEEIRKLENFETEGPFSLQKRFSQEKMKTFMGKLTDIKKHLEEDLATTYSKYDKSGVIYRVTARKIKRIEEVLTDIDKSKNKSAKDVHLSSDEF